jgi:hypothetical protein
MSALRLATGIQRVSGGDIFCIDTESRRALHYADKFTFRHVEFVAPFGPLDYLAAVEHCTKQGAKVVIIDSASHIWEGPGGVLEMHADGVQRMSGGDPGKAERVKMLAWAAPKAAMRRFLNSILQLDINLIFCLRAKEKLKIEAGKQPVEMGFQAICGDELVYELTVKCLLYPQSNGVPTWSSDYPGERLMMKLPEQFKAILPPGKQLDEAAGQSLAQWAAGGAPKPAKPSAVNHVARSPEDEEEAAAMRDQDEDPAEVALGWIADLHQVNEPEQLDAITKLIKAASLSDQVKKLIEVPYRQARERAKKAKA